MSKITAFRIVADGLTPVLAYDALRRADAGPSFLLESVIGGERWGRYSILGYRPRKQLVLPAQPGRDPFAVLAERISFVPHEGEACVASRLARSQVGYLAYDLASATFSKRAPQDFEEPLARLVSEMTVVLFDNLEQTVTIASLHADDVERARDDLAEVGRLRELPLPDRSLLAGEVEPWTSDERFEAAVRKVKARIDAGEARQIVLARTFATESRGTDGFEVYRAMRVLSPTPYMYFLDLPACDGAPAMQIAGASPETLVRWQDQVIAVRPIAGTRPRGRTEDEDRALEAELLADPKELSEHEMLIDLAREDVGRVALEGSITVPTHAQIERYSHVMHIVSEVQGKSRPEVGPWDVVRAAFPAGTLSGAPRSRAIEIIDELEPRPRGVYGGAVGWIGARELDLSIAIRTVVHRAGRFEVSAGAGIVEASVPALEVEETWNKAKAALAAIRASRGS